MTVGIPTLAPLLIIDFMAVMEFTSGLTVMNKRAIGPRVNDMVLLYSDVHWMVRWNIPSMRAGVP